MNGLGVSYEARMENLPALLDHVARMCEGSGVDSETAAELRLVVEEVAVNVIKHGYAGRSPGPIRLDCEADASRVRITVTDEAPPFNPNDLAPPDVDAAWEDRPIGGLGWHLVRALVDEVHHEVPASGGNRLTLVKRLS